MVGGGRPLLPEISGQPAPVVTKSPIFITLHYITLHAEIYSARSYEEKIYRACIT